MRNLGRSEDIRAVDGGESLWAQNYTTERIVVCFNQH